VQHVHYRLLAVPQLAQAGIRGEPFRRQGPYSLRISTLNPWNSCGFTKLSGMGWMLADHTIILEPRATKKIFFSREPGFAMRNPRYMWLSPSLSARAGSHAVLIVLAIGRTGSFAAWLIKEGNIIVQVSSSGPYVNPQECTGDSSCKMPLPTVQKENWLNRFVFVERQSQKPFAQALEELPSSGLQSLPLRGNCGWLL